MDGTRLDCVCVKKELNQNLMKAMFLLQNRQIKLTCSNNRKKCVYKATLQCSLSSVSGYIFISFLFGQKPHFTYITQKNKFDKIWKAIKQIDRDGILRVTIQEWKDFHFFQTQCLFEVNKINDVCVEKFQGKNYVFPLIFSTRGIFTFRCIMNALPKKITMVIGKINCIVVTARCVLANDVLTFIID